MDGWYALLCSRDLLFICTAPFAMLAALSRACNEACVPHAADLITTQASNLQVRYSPGHAQSNDHPMLASTVWFAEVKREIQMPSRHHQVAKQAC